MNCPQCGTDGYQAGVECRACGYTADQIERLPSVQVSVDPKKRDIMNGVGLGCSVLCFVWFFTYTVVAFLVNKNPAVWSTWGPITSVAVPLVSGALLYLALGTKSAFSRGIGYSLLISLVLAALFAYIGTKFHDTRPSPIASHNGFE